MTTSDAPRTPLPVVVTGACHHDCPDTCAWEVTVVDGVATRLRASADHPVTRGTLCPKVNRFLDRVHHPDRIRTPLRRTGAKGEGDFEPITWDAAIAEIAARIAQDAFEWLDAPVKRIAATDTFVAYAPQLEDVILPQVEDLRSAMLELAAY